MSDNPEHDVDTVFEPAWNEAVRDIPESGLERQREATPEQRVALAEILELVSVPSFRASYRIKPAGNGRYMLRGLIEATVEQTCVVSLKPLVNKIAHDLDASFWPEGEITQPPGGAVDIEDEPDPEPIVNGRLEIGRIVFETIASAIDPFPRAPEASIEWKSGDEEPGKASPFAALARLKK